MLNKYERIDLVRRLGLNTEENILITSDHYTELDKLNQFITSRRLKSVSIRTVSYGGEAKTPHYPIVNKHSVSYVIRDVLSQGYSAIVATPIDPADALLAGAVLKDKDVYHVELARGPCTVRRVTHEGVIDIDLEYRHRVPAPSPPYVFAAPDLHGTLIIRKMPDLQEDQPIFASIRACTKVPFESCVIELSYYRIPVGYKSEHVIIWDICSSGYPGSEQEIESYYYKITGDVDASG